MGPSQPSHPLSSLRNEETFPSYRDLDCGIFFPRDRLRTLDAHTAYVGEIVEDASFFRLCIKAADRTGQKILVAFHDSSRGRVVEDQCKVGSTIVILYPKSHWFMDGQVGYRIEDEDINHVKIFPHSYESLLRANALYFKTIDNPLACTNCSATPNNAENETIKKLSTCGRCKIVQYCNKECQVRDWNNGHKAVCRALLDVQWITKKSWGEIEVDESTGQPMLYENVNAGGYIHGNGMRETKLSFNAGISIFE